MKADLEETVLDQIAENLDSDPVCEGFRHWVDNTLIAEESCSNTAEWRKIKYCICRVHSKLMCQEHYISDQGYSTRCGFCGKFPIPDKWERL